MNVLLILLVYGIAANRIVWLLFNWENPGGITYYIICKLLVRIKTIAGYNFVFLFYMYELI